MPENLEIAIDVNASGGMAGISGFASAVSSLGGPLGSLSGQIGQVEGAFGKIGASGIAAAAGIAVVGGAMAAATQAAAGWQSSMTSIGRTTGLGDYPKQLAAMSDQLQQLRRDLGMSADAAASMAEQAGSIGVGATAFQAGDMTRYRQEIVDFVKSTQMLSGAWGMSSSATAEGVGKMGSVVLDSWNRQRVSMGEQEISWAQFAEKAGGSVDQLANQMGSKEEEIVTSMRHMSSSVAMYAPSEETYGKWTALASYMIETGDSADHAGEAIKDAMTYIGRDDKGVVSSLLGTDSAGLMAKMKTDAVATMQEISKAIASRPEAQRPELYKSFGMTGQTAIQKMVADIESGVNRLDFAIEIGVKGFKDADVKAGFDKVMADFNSQWGRVMQGMMTGLEDLGEVALPSLTSVLSDVADFMDWGISAGNSFWGGFTSTMDSINQSFVQGTFWQDVLPDWIQIGEGQIPKQPTSLYFGGISDTYAGFVATGTAAGMASGANAAKGAITGAVEGAVQEVDWAGAMSRTRADSGSSEGYYEYRDALKFYLTDPAASAEDQLVDIEESLSKIFSADSIGASDLGRQLDPIIGKLKQIESPGADKLLETLREIITVSDAAANEYAALASAAHTPKVNSMNLEALRDQFESLTGPFTRELTVEAKVEADTHDALAKIQEVLNQLKEVEKGAKAYIEVDGETILDPSKYAQYQSGRFMEDLMERDTRGAGMTPQKISGYLDSLDPEQVTGEADRRMHTALRQYLYQLEKGNTERALYWQKAAIKLYQAMHPDTTSQPSASGSLPRSSSGAMPTMPTMSTETQRPYGTMPETNLADHILRRGAIPSGSGIVVAPSGPTSISVDKMEIPDLPARNTARPKGGLNWEYGPGWDWEILRGGYAMMDETGLPKWTTPEGYRLKDIQMGRAPPEQVADYQGYLDALSTATLNLKENFLDCALVTTEVGRAQEGVMASGLFKQSYIGPTSDWYGPGKGGTPSKNFLAYEPENWGLLGVAKTNAELVRKTEDHEATVEKNSKALQDVSQDLKAARSSSSTINIWGGFGGGGLGGGIGAAFASMFPGYSGYSGRLEGIETGLATCVEYMSDFGLWQEGIAASWMFNPSYIGPTQGYAGPGRGARSGWETASYTNMFPESAPFAQEFTNRFGSIATSANQPIVSGLQEMIQSTELVNDTLEDIRSDWRDAANVSSRAFGTMGGMGGGLNIWGGGGGGGGFGGGGGGAGGPWWGWGGQYGSFFGGGWSNPWNSGASGYGMGAGFGGGGWSGGWGSWGGAASAAAGSGGHGSWGGVKWAEGGIVSSPTIGVFGESGREAFVPLDDKAAGLKILQQILPEFGVVRGVSSVGRGQKSAVPVAVTTNIIVQGDISSDVRFRQILDERDRELEAKLARNAYA
jgi:TP901 family phage tail tape measure protein